MTLLFNAFLSLNNLRFLSSHLIYKSLFVMIVVHHVSFMFLDFDLGDCDLPDLVVNSPVRWIVLSLVA